MQLVMQDGRSYVLRPGLNTVGRGADNTVPLENLNVSRKHAQIQWEATGVLYLCDLQSVNGTFINDEQLAPGQWRPITPGMRIRFGTEVAGQLIATPAPRPMPVEAAPNRAYTVADERGQPLAPARPAASAGRTPSSRSADLLMAAFDASFDGRKLLVAAGGMATTVLVLFLGSLAASSFLQQSVAVAVALGVTILVVAWLILAAVQGAITSMIHAQLTGQTPVTPRDALRFGLRRLSDLALSPLALAALGAILAVVEVLVLWIGRIQVVGPIVASLLFLPALCLNLLLIVMLLFGGSLLAPIIVDRGRGVAGTLSYLLALLRHAPGRVALYLALTGFISSLVTTIIWAIFLLGLALTISALTVALGSAGSNLLFATGWLRQLPIGLPSSLLGGGAFYGSDAGLGASVARILLQLGLLSAVTLAVALPYVLQATLACAVYLRLKEEVNG